MKTTRSGNGNNKASLISVNILTEIRCSIFDKPVLCPKIVKSRQNHELVKRGVGERVKGKFTIKRTRVIVGNFGRTPKST